MNDEMILNKLREIDLIAYKNPILQLIHTYPITAEQLDYLFNLDYSTISAKFAYFKKAYLNFYTFSSSHASMFLNILLAKGWVSMFDSNSVLQTLDQLLNNSTLDCFLVAFDYTVSKVEQLKHLSSIDESKTIKNTSAYFIAALKENIQKSASLYTPSSTLEKLYLKFGLKFEA